jgi:dTDP-4-dehydrorhamnose 3,5-epimerase
MISQVLEIEGPKLIIPKKHGDNRGYFCEVFKNNWFLENIADVSFVQENQSLSTLKGTIRGLHYQKEPFSQAKLIRVIRGSIFDVIVDIRKSSPTFGQYLAVELSADNMHQLWIPDGFLHGFCTLTDNCEVFYKVSAPYSAKHDAGIAFDDPDIGIEWPIEICDAILSDKDKSLPPLYSLV